MNGHLDDGDKNLRLVKKQNNFCDWMYSEIKPYLRGDILEIGSGLGTYSEKITKDSKNYKIFLSDINDDYLKKLKKIFQNQRINCIKLNLEKREDFLKIEQKFDSIIALNVLEHIKDDVGVLNYLYDLLRPQGRLIILVPAHKFLFNTIDTAIGHRRRYTKKEIKQKVAQTKFKIKKTFYFNAFSILGWYLNGNILKKGVLNEGVLVLFNKIVPLLKFIEKYLFFKKIGISLIAVLEK